MEQVGDIKFVITERIKTYVVSKPNYHTKMFFAEIILAIEIKKTQITMDKSLYFGLSILDLGKTVMYEFRYAYVKLEYGERAKLSCIDTDITHVKTDDIYKDIADVETRFDTSDHKMDRSLPKGKNKKVAGLMKDELEGQIMKKVVGLRAKTYSY